MRLRPKVGRILHQPLDTLFVMREMAGSPTQKYDASTDSYNADRTLTPFVLEPLFSASDKGGELPDGDYTDQLVNCVWTVTGRTNGHSPVLGTDYTIDQATHALTLSFNLDPDSHGKVAFTADFVDPRRGDVLKVEWDKTLSCVSVTDWKLTLQTQWPQRTDLIPWKNRGIFPVTVQLFNGETSLPDSKAVYQWQICDSNVWRNVDRNKDFWCRGGEQTKAISVAHDFVQKIQIRCLAWSSTETDRIATKAKILAFMLRRYYGFYDDDLDILEGAYVFPETTRAVAEAFVENHHGGRITNPTLYFDMEILYNRGDGTGWWHVCHGERGEVPRSMFPADATAVHYFAPVVRELSALTAISDGGKVLTIDGKILVGQFPVIAREFEDA
ncbi:MAG: hypothetical protein IJ804_08015 [Prevotella sp.]|nr:hypothetical protein [Prevotella sp.]